MVSNEHSREREEGCEMCAGDERKPGPACGVQGEKLITASEGWLCPWVQGCSCHTGRIFYLRHLAVEIVPFISAELAFHVTRVVSLGLCLSPSGCKLRKHLALLSLSLQSRAHKALTTSTDQNHIIFHQPTSPFSRCFFPPLFTTKQSD